MADFAAWFRREDYERIREIMEDSDRLPPSFDEYALTGTYRFRLPNLLKRATVLLWQLRRGDCFLASSP
jgi:hypothetical protein